MGLSEVPVSAVRVEGRFRKDVGDLSELAASIDAVGLLHPIGITRDKTLVFGLRRLRAAESLGLETITARVVHLDDPLRAERDENACRKDFTPSELVAIGRAIEDREKKLAAERQAATRNVGVSRPGKLPARDDKPETPKGDTRDRVASTLGVSGKTYEKAKAVVEAAERDPELFGKVVEVMDQTGNVSGAYKVVQETQARYAAPPPAPPEPPKPTRQPTGPVPTGPTPKEIAKNDPGVRWHTILHDMYVLMNSIRDVGGLPALVAKWKDPQRAAAVAELVKMRDQINEWVSQLEGDA